MKLVVIGAQWGDEGKGKIVDYLAEKAKVVVRYSGGANAGHTIVNGDKVYKLHLVPSGIVYPNSDVLLGHGVVIDPTQLFKELEGIKAQGLEWEGRVKISDRAHLVLPFHKELDLEMESKRIRPIGTTGRGIGIAYSLKAHRDNIRIGDLYDEGFYNSLDQEIRDYLDPYKKRMEPMVVNGAYYLNSIKDEDILFEGAQGTLLDLDNGTYPFVSSGYSCAGGSSVGTGMGPRAMDNVIGVFKAYSTRVGNGPFPSDIKEAGDGDLENLIREIGGEYGVTTGRARKCGYLDMVALKYACISNSLDSLVLTHLDVYDQMDEVKVCEFYEIDGKKTDEFPTRIDLLNSVKPVTRTFKGWKCDISKIKKYEDLPKEAREYIDYIEEYTGTPISIVSVGADRSCTFNRRDPWTKY
ncbi:adenylosuccinate synthase [Thiospirochaeta perfilievii]|uniref:Adenylosuccinate synthetase n=1 Tax=Thiospirochaeta perfilievii TaxID=252967 RepID=A0A5C1QFJ2_9SPIO|nr:adenylosuccinate synthase [Thiospirochaeta perfilievii]QEN06177.1 adenylosuccinate synthase [Thiospirochaeta perfilievii]